MMNKIFGKLTEEKAKKRNIVLVTVGVTLAIMAVFFLVFGKPDAQNVKKNAGQKAISKNVEESKEEESTEDENTEEENTEKESASWNDSKTLSKKDGDYKFLAYESYDKKSSWIYRIKVLKKDTKQELNIPESIKGRKVIKIGADMSGEDDSGFYKNVFGTFVEAAHYCDGRNKYIWNIPSISIPDTVTKIENSAFSGLESIKKLILPANLQKMGNDAFYSCDSLEEIYIPENYEGPCGNSIFECCFNVKRIYVSEKNKAYRTINDMLYSKDGETLIWVPSIMEKVVIPDNTKVIQSNTFSYSKVCDVTIPASVEKIEENAFWECPYVCNINLDKMNKAYKQDGTCIYEGDSKRLVLSVVKDHKLTISNQVEIIPGKRTMVGGFSKEEHDQEYPSDYPHVERADLPPSIIKLEGYWETFCSTNEYSPERIYFHSIEPPEHTGGEMMGTKVLYVPAQALDAYKEWNREGTYKSYIDGEKKKDNRYIYNKSNFCIEIIEYIGKEKDVIIPQEIEGLKVTHIGKNAFKNTKIISVKIPDTVQEIGENAFSYCKKLEKIEFSQNCKKLGREAFGYCKKIKSVELPDSLTDMEARAFFGCKSLESVTLPSELSLLHGKCFKNCVELKEIHIPETVKSIHMECFAGCKKLSKVDMPVDLQDTESGVFKNCVSLKYIVLPKGLDYLAGELFMGCINLETVDVKGKITGLGMSTFCDCYKLKKLEPIEITEPVGFCAFKNCKNLEATIEIMPGCEEIASEAFYNCPKVKVKNIENARYVADDAF